jgi:AsmA protein
MAPLLRDMADTDILAGTLKSRLNLSMSGEDALSIKQSLYGKGEANITNCSIIGLDLTALAEDPKKALEDYEKIGKAQTKITEFIMPFTISNGLFRTESTSVKSERVHMNATGTADIVQEKLDLLLKPTIVKTSRRDPSRIKTRSAVPIKITGTFDKPVFRADIKSFTKSKILDELGDDDSKLKKQAGELLKDILGGD